MSKDEELIKEMDKIDIEELQEITIKEIRDKKPKIFGLEPFEFIVKNISKARVKQNVKTQAGIGDMYILNTIPQIYTFSNAYEQLETFYIENNLKPNCQIKFVKKFIPEGLKSYDTKYVFEAITRGK